jgi:hypothetical protein
VELFQTGGGTFSDGRLNFFRLSVELFQTDGGTFSDGRLNFFRRAAELFQTFGGKSSTESRCFCLNCDFYDFYCRRIPNLHFKSVLNR